MAVEIRLLTVEDYHRMKEAGVFHPEERVELIAGQLIQMAAKGTAHTAALRRTNQFFTRLSLQVQMMVQIQDPIILDDYSQPEPDVAILRVNPGEYLDHHPTSVDVYLVIEIADLSLNYDMEIKGKLYAQSGMTDYWVLDVKERHLHVFREPSPEGYQSEVTITEEDSISPLQFPTNTIPIGQMLAPNTY